MEIFLLEVGRKNNDKPRLESANKRFKEALDAKSDHLWAQFGLGLSWHYLQRPEEAERELRKAIKAVEKRRLQDDRTEPRTKLLARTTEFICYALIPEMKEKAPAVCEEVIKLFNNVERNLCVFSQFRMRDVDRSEFESDLDDFAKEQKIETAR